MIDLECIRDSFVKFDAAPVQLDDGGVVFNLVFVQAQVRRNYLGKVRLVSLFVLELDLYEFQQALAEF